MVYEKLNLKKDDLLDEAVFKKIDDNFDQLINDLYDTKQDIFYTDVYQTTDIQKPTYKTFNASGTITGWWACIGKPEYFDVVSFPTKARSGGAIGNFKMDIYEFPDITEVTARSLYGCTPTPNKWNLIASGSVNLKEAITDSENQTIVSIEFDERINNTNGRYLYGHIYSTDPISLGVCEITYDDIPYNPYYGYSSSTTTFAWNYTTVEQAFDSTTVLSFPVKYSTKTITDEYLAIGVDKEDKFHQYVSECINNSSSFGSIFEEGYAPFYTGVGSQDLVASDTTTYDKSASSTISGVLFPCGVVPSDVVCDGATFKIRPRVYNDSAEVATKCYGYLYSVDTIPLNSTKPSLANVNAQLLRYGTATIEVAAETEETVSVKWNEPFQNTDGKFLMLGYNLNTPVTRCFCYSQATDEAVCGTIDGNVYSDRLCTYYTSKTTDEATWSASYWNDPANAWSLVTLEKSYELGEKFDAKLEVALEKALETTTVGTAPNSEIRLAKQYDLVVGDTFQLFYDSIIKSFCVAAEGVTVRCSIGHDYPRYYECTPKETEVGIYTLTVYTRKIDGTITNEATTKLVVHPKLTNETTPENLKILMFGDSLTSGGEWCAEGLRRIYGENASWGSVTDTSPESLYLTNTVTHYGSQSDTKNKFTVNHEGYGGWQWSTFLSGSTSESTTSSMIVTLSSDHGYEINTVQKSVWIDNNGLNWELEDFPATNALKFNRGDGNTGTSSSITFPTEMTCSMLDLTINPVATTWEATNPFYDEVNNKVSFAAHAAEHGVDAPDIVACLLTWNGSKMDESFNFGTAIDTHMTNATTLLRIIHEDFPNTKIIVFGIPLPSLIGGLGYNYGAKNTSDRWATAFYAFEYNTQLEALVTNSEFGEYCYFVGTAGQYDPINNVPRTTKNVNTRNSSITEIFGTNGVHPADEGYYQIGDAFYRALTKVIPLTMETTTE